MNSEIKINYFDIHTNNAVSLNKNVCMVKKSNLHNNIPIVNLSSKQRNIVQITDQSISRKNVGGKGSALYRMQQAGMKVPEFTTIDVKSVKNLENHILGIASLKPFINDIASFNLAEINIANIKQEIQIRYVEQSEQRNLYLQGLAKFIANHTFYKQITNSQIAKSIRENYNQLIASLSEDSAIIVRSSGIKEDNYGDAQAGKFESIVHGKQDIVLTCLQVLASGFQPHVCPFSAPQPMSLIIQRCIDCSFGGVAMSRTSLKDHRGKIEFVPGQPKGGVSGVAGITPHTYLVTEENDKFTSDFTKGNVTSKFILKQQDNNNFEEKPVALTENSSVNLTEEQLKQIYQYIKQGEDMLLCPVDFEFAIAKDGTVYALQLRPLTVLTGGVNFAIDPPENPITTGALISEGFCAGELFYVQSEQDADLVPQGAIVVAEHGESWMVDNNHFLEKVGGFIFQQGGANDHIAITMREREKPYLVATDNFDELKHSNAIVSLACGNFKENLRAYVTTGSEFADKLATMQSTVKADYKPISSEKLAHKIPKLYFNRPDIAFKNLHDLNYILLDYFNAGSWLTRCFTEKGMLLLSMVPHRIEIIKEAKQEIQQMFADFELFLQGYKQYLQLGMNSEVKNKELQQKLTEAEKLTVDFNNIKTRVNNNLDNILQQFTAVANQTISKGDFNQLLQNATKIFADMQKFNIPKAINEVSSLHDSISWIHREFIEALAPVAINSGLGTITRCREVDSIVFSDTEEQKAIEKLCINSMCSINSDNSKVVIMENAIIATAKLGIHACTIEMLEHAEAGKARTLKLKLSDDFVKSFHYQGKLKRFWFFTQLLHCISFDDNADKMNVSIGESTGILSIEVSHIETKKEMLDKFVQLIKALNTLYDIDIDFNNVIINLEERAKWNFSTLNQKIYNLTSKENQQEFVILVLLLGYNRRNILDFKNIYNESITCFFKQGKKLRNKIKNNNNIIDSEIEIILDNINIKNKEKLVYILLSNKVESIIKLTENKHRYRLINKENILKILATNGELISYINPNLYHDAELMLVACNNYGLALKYASDALKDNKDVVLAAVKNNSLSLKYASDALKNNKDFILAVIKKNAESLKYASDELKNNKDIVLAAVKSNASSLKYASDALKNDKDVVLAAVNNYVCALEYASDELKNDKDIVLATVKIHGKALKYASDALKNDKDVVLAAINKYFFALECASDALKNDKDIILVAVNNLGYALEYASDALKNDKDIVLAAIKKSGLALKYANNRFKNNKDIVLVAINNNGSALAYACDEFKNDKDVVLVAVKNDAFALEYASRELINNKNIVMTAVKKNGIALQYASNELKKDKDIILAAIKNNSLALQYATYDLRNDKNIVMTAVKQNAIALKYASDELKRDKKIILAIVNHNSDALKYVKNKLKDDKDIVLAAVNNSNGSALKYASKTLQNDEDVILAAIKFDSSFYNISDKLKNNKHFILKTIKANFCVYTLIDDKFKHDTEILQAYKTAKNR